MPGVRSSSLAQRRALPKLRSQNHVRAGNFFRDLLGVSFVGGFWCDHHRAIADRFVVALNFVPPERRNFGVRRLGAAFDWMLDVERWAFTSAELSREARDRAGEAPALPSNQPIH